MKQLVNLFRSARQKNTPATPTRKPARRQLRSEALEKRELLAGDILAAHNYAIAEDVNRDFKVTALDALLVINHMSRNGGSQDLSGVARGSMDKYFDVSGDNLVSPLDALRVINRLSRGEAVGELVELRLTPRTANDTEFSPQDFNAATRTLTVDVNEIFNLEVSYNDLRNRAIGGDFGAFGVFADIVTNLPDLVQPVLTETQVLRISPNVRNVASGSISINFAGGAPANAVSVPFEQFADTPTTALAQAISQMIARTNNTPNDLPTINVFELPNEGGPNDTIDFQVRFSDFRFDNQNLPSLVISSDTRDANNQPVVVTSTSESTEVRNPDNTINQVAVGLNLNLLSRTFNNEAFYGFGGGPSGNFSSSTGFTDVGGTGPILIGGFPSLNRGRLPEPFDAFSVPIRVVAPTTNLRLTLTPTGEESTAILLYESNDPVPSDLVLIDTTDNTPDVATDGFGILNVVAVNPSIVVTAGDSTLTFDEDPATAPTINLASLVTVTGATATPTFTITTQPAAGRGTVAVSSTGVATFTPVANDFTVAGSPITFVYTASAGGGSDTGTITVNITNTNDAPVFVADAQQSTAQGTALTITGSTLLANDLPGPANGAGVAEPGAVSIATTPAPTVATAGAGTVSLDGQNLVFTPATGFTGLATINYTITDGSLTSNASVVVNVTPVSNVTVAAADGALTFNEDPTAGATENTINLLALTTVTGSATAPTIVITTQPARGTVSVTNGIARFTPAANDFTTAGAPLTFVYTASVGTSSDTGTITVTINNVNDAPEFVADPALNATQGVALTITGSTLTSNDRPGPANGAGVAEPGTVSIATTPAPTVTTGAGTVTLSGQDLVYTPAAGFTGPATITYTITDGALTSTATQTVNVSAAGTVTVAAADSTLAVTEDTNATINLGQLTTVTNSTATPTFTITTQPARGVVTVTNGVATFDPADNDFTTPGAALTFVYTATVGSVSDTGTITVTISNVNDAPQFVADNAVAAVQGQALTITGSVLTSNDRPGPVNGAGVAEPGTVSIAATPAPTATNGTVTLAGQNLIYTPAANFVGAATISYTITDNDGLTASATLTVNVSAPNVVTVNAGDSTLTFVEDGPAQTLNLATLTTVSSGATATFTIVTPPARGNLVLNGSTVTYTPAADDFTTTPLTFVYRAAVGAVSDTGTVSINITPVNDPPSIPDNSSSPAFARAGAVTVFSSADILRGGSAGPTNEGEDLLLTGAAAITNVTRGTVAFANGNVTYTPPTGFLGTDQFNVTITDGTTPRTVVFNVNVANFLPSSVSGSIFIDYIQGLTNPARNGIRDVNNDISEPAFGGLEVRLSRAGVPDQTTLTDASGNYRLPITSPGTYTVSFVAPDTLVQGQVFAGSPATNITSTSFQVTIGETGGVNLTNNNFTLFGYQGAARERLDILVSQYELNHGSNPDFGTALVVMSEGGDEQQFFELGAGFDGVRFAELALNESRDSALLTVLLEDGTVASTLLTGDEIAISRNGRVVRILGGLDSFVPVAVDEALLAQEFDDFRNLIDRMV